MIRFIFLTFTIFSILFSKEPINQSQIVVKNNRDHCPEGFIDDCLTQNHCVELNWLGDGYCDDGSWGAYLECYMVSLIEGEIIGGPGQIVDSPDNGDCGTDNCANNGLESNYQGLCVEQEEEEIDYEQEDGEAVKNITATQRTDGSGIVDISYDLEPHSIYPSYYISVAFPSNDSQCWGDIHYNVLPGENKQIHCQLVDGISATVQISVKAKAIYVEDVPESIEMVTIPYNDSDDFDITDNGFIGHYETTFNDSYLDMQNYQYEMMTHEVTALQYVEFLNQVINSAIEIETNNDAPSGCTATRYILDDTGRYFQILSNDCGNTGDEPSYYELTSNQLLIHPYNTWADGSDGGYIWMNISDTFQDHPTHDSPQIIMLEYPNSFAITPGFANHPVTNVTAVGAFAFAQFYGLRIPYAYEWVNAAGNQWDNEGNYSLSGTTTTVGSYVANPNGLYDMYGNVLEFVINNSFYNGLNDPPNPWLFQNSAIGGYFNNWTPTMESYYYDNASAGFRCVRTIQSGNE